MPNHAFGLGWYITMRTHHVLWPGCGSAVVPVKKCCLLAFARRPNQLQRTAIVENTLAHRSRLQFVDSRAFTKCFCVFTHSPPRRGSAANRHRPIASQMWAPLSAGKSSLWLLDLGVKRYA